MRLDILINNAGIVDRADGLPGIADINAVRRIMETNFLGTLAVTQAMLPLLRQSAAGRIVNVSSGLGSLGFHSNPDWEYARVKLTGYCASKAALNMLTVQLAYELRETSIRVNSVAQGAAEAIRLALLGPDGPTGGFFSSSGANPW